MPTVYTKNNCHLCSLTKRALRQRGVPFVEVNVDEDAGAREMLVAKGFKQMPVVAPGREGLAWWSGFRLDLIKGLMGV